LCSLVSMKKKPESGAFLVMKNKLKASKIDDQRARLTYEQDRFVCVILHVSSWRYGHIVTFWCIHDDCNLCVCDFASQETCLCDYLYAVQFFVWFTYSLASTKKNKLTGAG
jgi:hypothetical protein